MDVPYICFKCGKPLTVSATAVACTACGASYSVVDGIPLFTKDRYWGKISAEEMGNALTLLDEKGWETFKEKYQKKVDVAFDESRADWRFETDLGPDSVVLDTGAGLGRNSIPLSRVVKQVVAFDQSLLRMRYLKRRAEKEGITNIQTFVGDFFELPLKEKSFDLIVMNGVLEWVGKTDRFNDPYQAQIESLKICKKLLKKGGRLYIGIENRFSFVYMRSPDHEGTMWTTFMPRMIADRYMRWKKGFSYQTYTHTKKVYARQLREAGFASSEFFLPYPGYNMPRIVTPYDDLRALRFTLTRLLSLKRLGPAVSFVLETLARVPFVLRFYRYFYFSFNIIARV
jgi:SAM-dependent methyltransferase